MKKPPFGKSLAHAVHGLLFILKTERNFRIHTAGLAINTLLIFVLKLHRSDALFIIAACFSVLITEILNTAVEKICDFVHPQFEPRIGLIKDMAAGAVLLSAVIAVVTGIAVYSRYLSA